MKIYLSKATYVETDELSNKELFQAHAYYYQLGSRDIALQLIKEKEKREQTELKSKKEVKSRTSKYEDN